MELIECSFCTEQMPYRYVLKKDTSNQRESLPYLNFCCDSCAVSYILKDSRLNMMVLEAQKPR